MFRQVADEGAPAGVAEPLTTSKIVWNASRVQIVLRAVAGPELLLVQTEGAIQHLGVNRLRVEALPGSTGLPPLSPRYPVARRGPRTICQKLASFDERALFVLHDKRQQIAMCTAFAITVEVFV
jgi:hypothetical protein